jgi:hypothetical protein
VTTEVENQLYRNAAILAHNLTRELQMKVAPRQRRTTPKRAALWRFSELETLRRTVIQRAGRKMRPLKVPKPLFMQRSGGLSCIATSVSLAVPCRRLRPIQPIPNVSPERPSRMR